MSEADTTISLFVNPEEGELIDQQDLLKHNII